jgi:3-isopropylmalate/(R)-2-methylmalate dehydratase large subunit
VHVIGPEQGATLPGMTVVCGDSHTSTHGAFGALAFGIGTSEVEHVLATQTLLAEEGEEHAGEGRGQAAARRDRQGHRAGHHRPIGTAGGTGYVIEFAGSAIRALSMEGRMTVCNMAIEAGARAGMVARRREDHRVRQGPAVRAHRRGVGAGGGYWRTLQSDPGAHFDAVVELDAREIRPQVTWGTSPEMVLPIDGRVPDPDKEKDAGQARGDRARAGYMGLEPNTPITDIRVDKVFIGSCTNSRIEDLREAAAVVRGRRVAPNVKLAMVVPGSGW